MPNIKKPKRRTKKETYAKLVKTANLGIPSVFAADIIDIIIQKRIDDKLKEGGLSAPVMQMYGTEIVEKLEKKGWDIHTRSVIERTYQFILSILGVIGLFLYIIKKIKKRVGGDEGGRKNRPSQKGKGGGNNGNDPRPPKPRRHIPSAAWYRPVGIPLRTKSLPTGGGKNVLNDLNIQKIEEIIKVEEAKQKLNYAKNMNESKHIVAKNQIVKKIMSDSERRRRLRGRQGRMTIPEEMERAPTPRQNMEELLGGLMERIGSLTIPQSGIGPPHGLSNTSDATSHPATDNPGSPPGLGRRRNSSNNLAHSRSPNSTPATTPTSRSLIPTPFASPGGRQYYRSTGRVGFSTENQLLFNQLTRRGMSRGNALEMINNVKKKSIKPPM